MKNHVSRRPKFLWEKLQGLLNDFLKRLLVTGREGYIGTVIDDDKVWCKSTGKNAEDRKKIKYTVHVRDNRRGFNFHTFATFFNFFPLHIIIEEPDISAASALQQGVKFLFGSSDSEFHVGGDRGYFGGGPSIKTICEEGGEIIGTTKKGRDTPFTTGNVLDDNDKRIVLDPTGCPCLFVSESRIKGKKLSAVAFRTGSGSISNAISSTHHGHWWDAQSVTNWNHSPYATEFFHRCNVTTETNIQLEKKSLGNIIIEEISVITIEQGRACWHLLRKFSLTSHPSIETVRCMFHHFWKESNNKEDWKFIAEKVYGENWQHSNNDLVPIEDRDGSIIFCPNVELQSLVSYAASWSVDSIIGSIKILVATDICHSDSDARSIVSNLTICQRKEIFNILSARLQE